MSDEQRAVCNQQALTNARQEAIQAAYDAAHFLRTVVNGETPQSRTTADRIQAAEALLEKLPALLTVLQ